MKIYLVSIKNFNGGYMVVAKDKRNALRQCFGALHVVDVEIEILSELVPKSWEEFVLARLTN